ncbi:sirohydrochlorin cobaltochelatase [Clostridium sp. AL.422]|uniref:sirohydrochlorin cobaltochelatase n=1 Tax=Clostridium TaxID=1485 RepID=UPI00293DC8CA|nr:MULTISPECIES: sirohydrochlorin cobaltochelatase [unclassified Clostridium]MDV4149458.1 sirohydrochlorin cobaltochelatase [Clostridium sp. AL.422]
MAKAIVIVSFGTANLEGLKILEDFENKIRESFNGKYHVCKAFTSSMISNILFTKYGKSVPRLEEVLFNLSNDRYKEVYIQPLHIIEGSEYLSIVKTIEEYDYSFSKITLGRVIMGENEGRLMEGCNLIVDSMEEDLNKSKNLVLVGHGSKVMDTEGYNLLKNTFLERGFKSVFIGTLDGENKREDVVNALIDNKINETIMAPILMLPGNHIVKDIFGNKNSWKSLFQENNITVESSEKSLLEYDEIRNFYIELIDNNINR